MVSGQRQREKHLLHEGFNGGALPATLPNSEQKRFTHNTQGMLRDFRSASQKIKSYYAFNISLSAFG